MAHVLVYQPQAHKVLSVSRKKIVCHEGMYANFDPTKATTPTATITEINPETKLHHLRLQVQNENEDARELTGVHSIKVLRDSQQQNNSMMSPLTFSPISLLCQTIRERTSTNLIAF
jgi:hypothetical protein